MNNEPSKQTLGVVAICKNEERDLPGFLDHLLPWVDEIVLVDDGSDDRTESIASAAGETVNFMVSPRAEGEYYADQRNKGIVAAKSDWLLHMDIDERIPRGLAKEIQDAIQNPGFDGYKFRRLNYFLHRPMRGGGWQDWNMVHLAKRELFHFEGMFHETCVLDAPPERVGQLTVRMLHLNDASYRDRMRKSFTYSEEQAQRLARRYRRVGWIHLLGLPVVEFIRKYMLKKGFRDGVPGFLFSLHSADAMFRACALVWDEQNRIPREQLEKDLRSE